MSNRWKLNRDKTSLLLRTDDGFFAVVFHANGFWRVSVAVGPEKPRQLMRSFTTPELAKKAAEDFIERLREGEAA